MSKKTKEIKCIHRHTIDSHPKCFAKGMVKWASEKQFVKETGQPWYLFPGNKMGFLDIESDGLKADFSTMLSWCIKDRDGGYTYDVINRDDLFNGTFDKKLVESLIKKMSEYKILVTYYGCVTPGHKILKSDLTWVDVETLKQGDELLGFEEEAKPNYRTRQYTKSTVKNNIPMIKEVFEIKLSNGELLRATEDHPWLVQLGGGRRGDKTGYWVWRTTEQLKENMCFPKNPVYMTKMLDVWEEDNSYESGYIAGFFDGEGCVSQSLRKNRKNNHYNLQICASQNSVSNKDIVDRVNAYLDRLNFSHTNIYYDPGSVNQLYINIVGGLSERLKFMGMTGLVKKCKTDLEKLGRITNCRKVQVISIESLGNQVVCGLETSSKTYIVNGYGSHNTGFDIPYIRTKALHYEMDFPSYGEIYNLDLFYMVKSKLCLSSKSLANVCDYLHIVGKTPLDKEIWRKAKYGDPVALKEVLVHNMEDTKISEELYNKMLSFRKTIHTSI